MSDIHFTDYLGRKCVVWFAVDSYVPSDKAISEVKGIFQDAELGPSMELGDIEIDQLFSVARWNCYPLRVQLGAQSTQKSEEAEQ